MFESRNGDDSIVKLLLGSNADVNAKNTYGLTALMYESMEGHLSIVKMLLMQKQMLK